MRKYERSKDAKETQEKIAVGRWSHTNSLHANAVFRVCLCMCVCARAHARECMTNSTLYKFST